MFFFCYKTSPTSEVKSISLVSDYICLNINREILYGNC